MSRPYVPLFASIRHSLKLADLPSDTARMLYLLMLPQCDAWGRITAEPRRFIAEVCPMLGKSPADVAACIAAWEKVGLVQVFGESDQYIQIPDWDAKGGSVGKKDHRPVSAFPSPSGPPRAKPGQAGPSRATPDVDRDREESRTEEKADSLSSTKGHRGKRDVLFQEAEEKPAQPAKPPRARSAAEKLWLEAWKATRGEDYALLRADCIVLNKLGDQFGPDALGMKIHSLLSDTDKFVATNASPRLLESRWNQVGSLPLPGRKLAPPGRAEKLKAILDAGEPKRGTEAWCVWDSARQELATIKFGGAA